MQNKAQFDLDRKAAKISALSCNNWVKYEYLNGEDLGLIPRTVEQAKFEYSPLGKMLHKGLSKVDKKNSFLRGQKKLKIKMKSSYKQLKIKEKNNQKNLKILTRAKR